MATALAQQVGAALYRLRIAQGYSREDVVSHNAISLNALAAIENGQALVKLDRLTMLVEFYGLTLAAFMAQYMPPLAQPTITERIAEAAATTRFFVFDTKGASASNHYQDDDFGHYHWRRGQFNRVRPGDWFLYRRPQSASETRQWYFFGVGQVGIMTDQKDGNVIATVVNGMPFVPFLQAEELIDFEWTFKTRTGTGWGHFFNQYGMTEINRQDLLALLQLTSVATTPATATAVEEASAAYQVIRALDPEDTTAPTQINRRVGQQYLAEIVKADYGYRCAVTGIHTRQFLVASHIMPWRADQRHRLDPRNVICLSSLWDRAFDQGFVTFSPHQHRIIVSPHVQADPQLAAALSSQAGQVLALPKHYQPAVEALTYHNDVVFRA